MYTNRCNSKVANFSRIILQNNFDLNNNILRVGYNNIITSCIKRVTYYYFFLLSRNNKIF